ncbi:carbonic anhydrase [Xylariaceae sp. FL0255]|nr:carbonic anhydrase [Xylariaceae sp. FL0255]
MMSFPSLIPEFYERSKDSAVTHKPPPMIATTPIPDRPHTIIFCCIDGRIDPIRMFNLKFQDAIVIRNAGCVMPRMINDLLVLDQVADLREILVISHTDCGLTHVTDDIVHTSLKERNPGHDEEIDSIPIGSFKDHVARVKSDVEYIKSHPFVRKEFHSHIHGAVYDIQTGKLTKVELDE